MGKFWGASAGWGPSFPRWITQKKKNLREGLGLFSHVGVKLECTFISPLLLKDLLKERNVDISETRVFILLCFGKSQFPYIVLYPATNPSHTSWFISAHLNFKFPLCFTVKLNPPPPSFIRVVCFIINPKHLSIHSANFCSFRLTKDRCEEISTSSPLLPFSLPEQLSPAHMTRHVIFTAAAPAALSVALKTATCHTVAVHFSQ